ncbi:18001_t:CDS:2 [Racocetra persica]|uniref:18001_t:CDS:1 n=1 Tax=Racocetra persica TaxID=160502 RepID=A0ACA9QNB2_9GLOM|nr:18001_t:CDS:2 [Racocetra persica]
METERLIKKPKLSDHLLELKFMQRTQQKLRIAEENARHLAINGESQWWLNYDDVEIGKPKINIKYCPSYFSCINPTFAGRMSFGKKEEPVRPEIITLDDDDVTVYDQKPASKSKRKRDSILPTRKKRSIEVQNIEYIDDNDEEALVPQTRYNLRSRKPSSSQTIEETITLNTQSNRAIEFMKPPE